SGRSFPPQVSLSQVSLSQVSLAFFPAFAETGVLTLTSFRFFAGIPEARFGGPFGVKGSGWSASFRVARVGGVGGHGSPASSPPSKLAAISGTATPVCYAAMMSQDVNFTDARMRVQREMRGAW